MLAAIIFAIIVYFYIEMFLARARQRRIQTVTKIQKKRRVEAAKKKEVESITKALEDVERELRIQEEINRLTGESVTARLAALGDEALLDQALIKQRRGRPEMEAHIDQTLRQADVRSRPRELAQSNLVDFDTDPEDRTTTTGQAVFRGNPNVQGYYNRFQSANPVRNLST